MNPAGNVHEMFTELVKFEKSLENVKKKNLERKISKVPDGKFRANKERVSITINSVTCYIRNI